MAFIFGNTIKKRVMVEVASRIQAGEQKYEDECLKIVERATAEIEAIGERAKQEKSDLADKIVKGILG